MKKRCYLFVSFLILMFLISAGISHDNREVSAKSEVRSRKIIIFKQEIKESEKDEEFKKHGGMKLKNLKLVNASAAFLTEQEEKELKKSDKVAAIEEDIIVETARFDDDKEKEGDDEGLSDILRASEDRLAEKVARKLAARKAITQPTQTLPWGVDRIDAEKIWSATGAADTIKVAVIDSGVDKYHPDLIANLKGGVSAVSYTQSYNDDDGHGTHVAGIIAAADNSIGAVGVGNKIDIYAVKALDRNGRGYTSDVIEGIDWAIQNGMNVINMSLGSTSYSQSMEAAIKRANAADIVIVAAAGNDGPGENTVKYPAKFPEVIAVSATDKYDNIAYWSSRGPEVDLAAPGKSIYSTYKGKTYKTISGTSMASPHVAGVAALVLSVPAKCDYDGSGKCSPSEVQRRLEETAEQVEPDTAAGKDNIYGAGLVDAEKAAAQ